jgi:hypothetical protein
MDLTGSPPPDILRDANLIILSLSLSAAKVSNLKISCLFNGNRYDVKYRKVCLGEVGAGGGIEY